MNNGIKQLCQLFNIVLNVINNNTYLLDLRVYLLNSIDILNF